MLERITAEVVAQELAVLLFELTANVYDVPFAVLVLDPGFSIWPMYGTNANVSKPGDVLLIYPVFERGEHDTHLLHLICQPVKCTKLAVTCKQVINHCYVWRIGDILVVRARCLLPVHDKARDEGATIIFSP